jgi:hypothetical protein
VVGDEIWQRLLRAEQELELEVKDVVQEVWLLFLARELDRGWGQANDSYEFLCDYIHKKTNNLSSFLSLGKRLRAKLGPNHFPIRVRNGRERCPEEETRRHYREHGT